MTTDPPPRAVELRPASDRTRPDATDPAVRYMMREEGFTGADAIEALYVQGHAGTIVTAARAALGARFGTSRIADSGHILIKAVHPTAADRAALDRAADSCGIAGWVDLAEFDPASITAWDDVRAAIEQLDRDVYRGGDWGNERREPPFEIRLAAHAEAVAADLWHRFGRLLELRVGMLDYPPRPGQSWQPRLPRDDKTAVPLNPAEYGVALDEPLVIPTGRDATGGLILSNSTRYPVTVGTNGRITAVVVDPATGRVVGGHAGGGRMRLVRFIARPGAVVRIPLLVGTASRHADLGYTVPPGRWAVTATLELDDRRRLVTPPLDITISR